MVHYGAVREVDPVVLSRKRGHSVTFVYLFLNQLDILLFQSERKHLANQRKEIPGERIKCQESKKVCDISEVNFVFVLLLT